MSAETRDIQWGEDPETWNIEEGQNGEVGIGLFSKALQVWACRQPGDLTIGTAAIIFRCSEKSIREAIAYHPYMLIGAGDTIEHDGE